MSEEQPTFKVTDRRLFNPDGTPREVPREETEAQTDAATQPAVEPQVASASVTADTQPSASAAAAEAEAEQPAPIEETQSHAERSTETGGEAEEIPGANDPASFVNFIMSIASNAASSLGMMEHPVTGERDVDLELAKHWIDILGMLRQKTRGNL